MTTFLVGMAILILGGYFYGAYCERTFGPDDRKTPAVKNSDGVDFVPMKKWKNCLIELLNIAGTGPILGPIQGILFGPIAFILIPIGCVIGGAMHDYMSGMISLRNNGNQMPDLVKKHLGKKTFNIYNVFVCLVMLLVGAVFIYTPGDLIVTNVLNQDSGISNPVVWIVYGLIFAYYFIATVFPIDKIIGKIYPILGGLLILSTIGIGIGLFANGYELQNLAFGGILTSHPDGVPLFPVFFVTVACGIVSGFHATQATLVARTVESEKEGRMTYFNMMIVEGIIAMIWAAAAMGIYAKGVDAGLVGTPAIIGLITNDMFGSIGSAIAMVGIIVLPITSGDTALRSLRLMVADFLKIEQTKKSDRLKISFFIFAGVSAILIFAKLNTQGFNVLWRYFAWSNQTLAVFTFSVITVYLYSHKKNYLISLVPCAFYAFIISSYIFNASIGLNLNLKLSYVLGLLFSLGIVYLNIKVGRARLKKLESKKMKNNTTI